MSLMYTIDVHIGAYVRMHIDLVDAAAICRNYKLPKCAVSIYTNANTQYILQPSK